MKRVSLWTLGFGLFIAVGLLTIKPGYARKKTAHQSARWRRCKDGICSAA